MLGEIFLVWENQVRVVVVVVVDAFGGSALLCRKKKISGFDLDTFGSVMVLIRGC